MPTYIPHELLHKLAEACKPELPLKERSTWVAILRHDKHDPAEIGDEKDFLWLKCHSRITVRTLKHFYFSRFFIEDLRFKHKHCYPRNCSTITALREQQEEDEYIVVLRAFEPKDANVDVEMEADKALAQQILNFGTMNDAIVIDEDEDTAQPAADLFRASAGADDITDDTNTDDTGVEEAISDLENKSYTSSNTSWMKNDLSNPEASHDGSTTGLVPNSAYMGRSNSAIDQDYDNNEAELGMCPHPNDEEDYIDQAANQQLLRESAERSLSLDPFSSSPAHVHSTQSNIAGTSSSELQIPKSYPSQTIADSWQVCQVPHCQKHFHVKPWTQFGPENGALCTRDSRLLLIANGETELRDVMDHQLFNERQRKVMLQQAGVPQNMDDDQPVNEHWQVGSQAKYGHMDLTTMTPSFLSYSSAPIANHSFTAHNGISTILDTPSFDDIGRESILGNRNNRNASFTESYAPVNNYSNASEAPRFDELGLEPSTFDHNTTNNNFTTNSYASDNIDSNRVNITPFSQIMGDTSPSEYGAMDTSFADEYLSLIDPDSLLGQVDAILRNRSPSHAATTCGVPPSQYVNSNGTVHAQSGQEDDAQMEEGEQEHDMQSESSEASEPDSPIYIDVAAMEDDEKDSDYADVDD